jgi:N-acyl homoserine lactone hydrolase
MPYYTSEECTLRNWILLLLSVFLSSTGASAASAQVTLWRLDCGTINVDDLNMYSDTYAYIGRSKALTASCYLIKHGETYMLWDTGLTADDVELPLKGKASTGETLSITLVEQLAKIGISPAAIRLIGISHYHDDHTGQAAAFPQAQLLIGQGDLDALRKPSNPFAKPLEHWIRGDGLVEGVRGDKDVFGDGTVVMVDLPGHTPGHHGLLVKLALTGYVLLSGDVAHFRDNYVTNGVPSFNTDRSQSLSSLARFKDIARNLHAIVVIQHEPRDIAKLPIFPASAQ